MVPFKLLQIAKDFNKIVLPSEQCNIFCLSSIEVIGFTLLN